MEDQEFQQLFQQSSSFLREKTMHQLLRQNTEYQEICQWEEAAEEQYLQLELNDNQREVIDILLQHKEKSCLLYADIAYLAGIKNVLQLHRLLDI